MFVIVHKFSQQGPERLTYTRARLCLEAIISVVYIFALSISEWTSSSTRRMIGSLQAGA